MAYRKHIKRKSWNVGGGLLKTRQVIDFRKYARTIHPPTLQKCVNYTLEKAKTPAAMPCFDHETHHEKPMPTNILLKPYGSGVTMLGPLVIMMYLRSRRIAFPSTYYCRLKAEMFVMSALKATGICRGKQFYSLHLTF